MGSEELESRRLELERVGVGGVEVSEVGARRIGVGGLKSGGGVKVGEWGRRGWSWGEVGVGVLGLVKLWSGGLKSGELK